MQKAIRIHSSKKQVYLTVGVCKIYILGGWGVHVGKFSISLKNVKTDEWIKAKPVFWRFQSFAFGKRAKRIFTIDILKSGDYELIFINPESIKVSRSSLFTLGLLTKPLPNKDLEICLAN